MQLYKYSLLVAFVMITPTRAMAGEIDEDGMSLSVNFRYPTTPAELEVMKGRMTVASRILCDATEGGIFIKDVRFVEGGPTEGHDILVTPENGRSISGIDVRTGANAIDDDTKHIRLRGPGTKSRPGTIAHELMHYAVGLGDGYREPTGRRSNGSYCSYGETIEAPTEASHTLMQWSGRGSSCKKIEAGTMTSVDGACDSDADCTTAGARCFGSGIYSSDVSGTELSVPVNHEGPTSFGPWMHR